MSKYASLLFGPEKYYEIGPFRFPVYHDLVAGEARRIEEFSKQQSKATYKSIKLAQRIAKDKGISTKEAVKLLSQMSAAEGETPDIVYEYAEEIEDLNAEGGSPTTQKIELVTMFMQCRGEAKLGNPSSWTPLTDWATEDTEKMPPHLLDGVSKLLEWEKNGWPENNQEGKEGNGQAAQKSLPAKK